MSFLLQKLSNKYIWKRLFYERLTEPVHLNLLSVLALFGSFRSKVSFDLIVRQFNAYSILKCADEARRLGIAEVTLVEFGVAAGAGLLNMCSVAKEVSRETGINFKIVGFDTGTGMPPPLSYRDHPDLYQTGDFPMDFPALSKRLPGNAELVIGDMRSTVPTYLKRMSASSPIGYVSIDVDYYSSTKDALRLLSSDPLLYLPRTLVYLDDLEDESHNSYCGETLAIHEFNLENEHRKIEHNHFLRSYRIFRNARWIDHMFTLHILDHPTRMTLHQQKAKAVLDNPYL